MGLSAPASSVRISSGRSPSASAVSRYAASCSRSSGIADRAHEQELRPEQPDAVGAGGDRAHRVRRRADVRRHLDRHPVDRAGRFEGDACASRTTASRASRAAVSSDTTDASDPRRPRPVDPSSATDRPVGDGEHAVPGADDGRDAQRPREHGRVRRRSARSGHDPERHRRIQPHRVGGREIARDDDAGRLELAVPGAGARGVARAPVADAPEIGCSRPEVLVLERVPSRRRPFDHVVP